MSGVMNSIIESEQTIVTTVTSFMTSQFALNYIFNSSFNSLLASIASIQIIMFQLCKVQSWPSNLTSVMRILSQIINFEIFDPTLVTKQIYDFSKDYEIANKAQNRNEVLNFQLVEAGIGSYNPILNVGGLFFIIVLMFLCMVAVLVCKLAFSTCFRKTSTTNEGGAENPVVYTLGRVIVEYQKPEPKPKVSICMRTSQGCQQIDKDWKKFSLRDKVDELFRSYFFSAWIVLVLEVYFIMAIAGLIMIMLNEQQRDTLSSKSFYSFVSSQILGYSCLVMSVVLLPILVLLVPLKNCFPKINLNSYLNGISMNIDSNKKYSCLYPVIFVYRRLVIVVLIVFFFFESALSCVLLVSSCFII